MKAWRFFAMVLLLAVSSCGNEEVPITVEATREVPVTVEVTREVEVTSELVASGTEATIPWTVEETETIKDRVGERSIVQGMHNGRGEALVYPFFYERDPSIAFFEIVFRPGAFAGYHRHEGSEEILLVVSGKAENFQGGKRRILDPGDAILVKSGQAHAIRNIGDKDLKVLGVLAPIQALGSVRNLLHPDEISDWK